MNKQQLRELFLSKRTDLSAREIAISTKQIVKQFSKLSFNEIEYLHLFLPIIKKFEFNSFVFKEWIKLFYPDIKLVLSHADFQNYLLKHILWTFSTNLITNRFGITEPKDGCVISPTQLDMILVPLLAFDEFGNRVGYGKGFYDRFLRECRPDALKVGVSFFEPVKSITDVNEHDIKLDICITPHKTWEF